MCRGAVRSFRRGQKNASRAYQQNPLSRRLMGNEILVAMGMPESLAMPVDMDVAMINLHWTKGIAARNLLSS